MNRLALVLILAASACSDAETQPRAPEPLELVAVTFNTGSGPEHDHDAEPDDGYSQVEADLTDAHYGNGLAWEPFIEETRAWFDATQPDVVAFQEIFYAGDCPSVPVDAREGFICEDWSEGEPTVAQRVLGDGWQISCHPGKPDKCLAVHERLGKFQGCDDDLCLDGLDGAPVPDCGSGARVARGVIELEVGGTLTVVNFHGTSGFTSEEAECRRKQVDQVFVDMDGEPGANGARNLVLGDFNTDPGRLAAGDVSAARWNEIAEQGRFAFHTEVGMDAEPTYLGVANIDHVVSDAFSGDCWHAGVTDGHPAVTDAVFFDHRPAVCTLSEKP